eukprot:scpid37443/ scgid9676/ 
MRWYRTDEKQYVMYMLRQGYNSSLSVEVIVSATWRRRRKSGRRSRSGAVYVCVCVVYDAQPHDCSRRAGLMQLITDRCFYGPPDGQPVAADTSYLPLPAAEY